MRHQIAILASLVKFEKLSLSIAVVILLQSAIWIQDAMFQSWMHIHCLRTHISINNENYFIFILLKQKHEILSLKFC